jgi:hypothetical protein
VHCRDPPNTFPSFVYKLSDFKQIEDRVGQTENFIGIYTAYLFLHVHIKRWDSVLHLHKPHFPFPILSNPIDLSGNRLLPPCFTRLAIFPLTLLHASNELCNLCFLYHSLRFARPVFFPFRMNAMCWTFLFGFLL